MSDLIQIQLITSSAILLTFAVALRFGLFRKAFRKFDIEEGFPVFRVIVIATMLYLAFLIVRDLWRVLS
ncbi:MAG TPA: hypothetical protein VGU23_10515 [Acidobacteriaceae bacterium]|nr:hypothetical protein [Acidobacteriaceae bacterium]